MTSNSVDLYENSSSFVISSGSKPWSFWCLVESSYCKCTNHKISMSTRRPPARAPSPPCTHCSSATRSTRRGQFPNRRHSRPYLASGGPLASGPSGPFPYVRGIASGSDRLSNALLRLTVICTVLPTSIVPVRARFHPTGYLLDTDYFAKFFDKIAVLQCSTFLHLFVCNLFDWNDLRVSPLSASAADFPAIRPL